jgi:DNA-3-methyladenine glycosylase II
VSREAIDSLEDDEALAPLIEEYGVLELTPAEDLFERFVVSLLRQQVSMAAARAIRERLFERFEITPESILAADDTALRDVGLSAAKVEYANAAAERFDERGYDHAYFAEMPGSEVLAELIDIHGVGPWTAKMFLLFCLGREDVFPVEDLGIRTGMRAIEGEEDLTRAAMRDRASEWAPYRSYASLYLWRAADE